MYSRRMFLSFCSGRVGLDRMERGMDGGLTWRRLSAAVAVACCCCMLLFSPCPAGVSHSRSTSKYNSTEWRGQRMGLKAPSGAGFLLVRGGGGRTEYFLPLVVLPWVPAGGSIFTERRTERGDSVEWIRVRAQGRRRVMRSASDNFFRFDAEAAEAGRLSACAASWR